jgi:ATPase subunit of ABC transporter with duplicated ATPase domains
VSLIRLQNVFKGYDNLPVLRDVYFRLKENDRIGLIGKNGSGKTTLLKLILKQEQPDSGEVVLNPGIQIGYFSQFTTLTGELSVDQVLDHLFGLVHQLEEKLLEIEIAIEENPELGALEKLLDRQASLLAELERIGGWTYQNRMDTALTQLGFNQTHRHLPIGMLSEGWRNRAALAYILLQDPDVLLLDEPTNFLDVDGLSWLEDWLVSWRGGCIVVSHDRQFLDKVTNRIIEIENYHLQEYKGNFTEYVRQKPMRLKSLERQFEYEETLIAFEAQAISDQRELQKNPSRETHRRLANIKKQTEPPLIDRIITGVYDGLVVSKDLCQVENLSKAYDKQLLFKDLSFELHRGDRIVVIGPNGCGKSTLLRALTQEEIEAETDPAYDQGQVKWLKGSSFVHYNNVLDNLDLNDTVSHAVNVVDLAYLAQRKKINQFLSLFRFSEMDLYQKIGTLSGGQRARVALAQCLLSGASVILLDEPTNHLDLTSTQVMERALVHFPGALVVVSHDRFFIDKIATRLLVFKGEGRVEIFTGNYTMYISPER